MRIRGVDRVETGINLKRLMRKSRVTTFELQVALNLTSPSTIYSWLSGKYLPNADNLVCLAQIFGCQVDDILVLEGEND